MEKQMRNPFLPLTFDFFEAVATEDLPKIQPLNGRWTNLEKPGAHAIYNFDATKTDPDYPSKTVQDSCGPPNSRSPVYSVTFGGDDFSHAGISIAFYRCGRTSDHPEGFGASVFQGVQRAIYDYVMTRKPIALSWYGVARSERGDRREREEKKGTTSRTRVYEMLSRSHLFPDYVSYKPDHWLRRDVYEKLAVPEGMPAVDNEIKVNSPLAKKKAAINDMREKSSQKLVANYTLATDIASKIDQFGRKERKEAKDALNAKRLENINTQLNDPQQNPHRIKANDLVHISLDYPEAYKSYIDIASSHNHVKELVKLGRDYGKVVDFHFENVPWENGNEELLLAKVFLADAIDEEHHENAEFTDYYVWLPVRILEKYNHERREKDRISRADKMLDDPAENPKGFRIGQEIVCVPDDDYKYSVRRYEDGFQHAGVGEKFKIIVAYQSFGRLYLKAKFVGSVLETKVPEWLSNIINHHLDHTVYTDRTIDLNPRDHAVKPVTSATISQLNTDYKKIFDTLNPIINKGENRLGFNLNDEIVSVQAVDYSEIENELPIGQIGQVQKIEVEGNLVPSKINTISIKFAIAWKNKNILANNPKFQEIYSDLNTWTLAKSKTTNHEGIYYATEDDRRIKKYNEETEIEVKNNFDNMYSKYQELLQKANKHGLKNGDEVIVTLAGQENSNFSYDRCKSFFEYIGVGKLRSFKMQKVYDITDEEYYTTHMFSVDYDEGKTQELTGKKPKKNNVSVNVAQGCLIVVPYNPAQILTVKNYLHGIKVFTKTNQTKEFINRQAYRYSTNAGTFTNSEGDKIVPNSSVLYTVDDENWERGIFIGFKDDRTAYVVKNKNARREEVEEVPFNSIKPFNVNKSRAKQNFVQHDGAAFVRTDSPDALYGMFTLKHGDPVDVTAGEHANKSGHIVSWRRLRGVPFESPSQGRGDMGAVIATYPTPDKPSETIVVPVSSLRHNRNLSRFETFIGFLSKLNCFLVERL
jgi:hypothetical protein